MVAQGSEDIGIVLEVITSVEIPEDPAFLQSGAGGARAGKDADLRRQGLQIFDTFRNHRDSAHFHDEHDAEFFVVDVPQQIDQCDGDAVEGEVAAEDEEVAPAVRGRGTEG